MLCGQINGYFAELLPDLNWEVQEMIEEGNTVVGCKSVSPTMTSDSFAQTPTF